eukprot:TRINITY_DN11610_c0_g1_i5.p1 TRINITY_DN11610_c0_g1~~TRINITY_DN11610_c0_g1_i5.p1  ORF type:complete len:546 (+),score=121.62 TRINITY_DN11610_c0_g1_i5:112-1749(+)
MTEELSYIKLKTANEARMAEEARTEKLKRNIIVLMLNHLQIHGYIDSASALEAESGVSMHKFDVCDNIDLISIVQEFEAFYQIKFGRAPKLIKKLRETSAELRPGRIKAKKQTQRARPTPPETTLPRVETPPSVRKNFAKGEAKTIQPHKPKARRPASSRDRSAASSGSMTGLTISARPIESKGNAINTAMPQVIDVKSELASVIQQATDEAINGYNHHDDKLLKPVASFGYTGQMRDLAAVISRDIYSKNPNVRWKDIIGLDKACKLVKEAVVYPIRYPQLFKGILSPWKGLLLYGPPGTGKTMLAKAIATECQTTFFNISSSSIVSKWRGDSEKLVRVLFELARHHAPSTIFLDELDSIMSTRDGGQGGSSDHEGSRRMKTELLMQMDGLSKSDDLVFVLGASNLPWELDPAMLRRLEKRILVDLPTKEARKAMLQHHLPPVTVDDALHGGVTLRSEVDYDHAALQTDGYSGSDIKLVCKEAAMRSVRKIFDVLETTDGKDMQSLELDPITTDDVMAAIATTKPSAAGMQARYKQWQLEFESV